VLYYILLRPGTQFVRRAVCCIHVSTSPDNHALFATSLQASLKQQRLTSVTTASSLRLNISQLNNAYSGVFSILERGGARVERRKCEGWGAKGAPSRWEWGLGRRLCRLPRNIFNILSESGVLRCTLKHCFKINVHAAAGTRRPYTVPVDSSWKVNRVYGVRGHRRIPSSNKSPQIRHW